MKPSSNHLVWLVAALFASPEAARARTDPAPADSAGPRSPKPSKAEWRAAAHVTPARLQGRQAAHCAIVQVREWLRVWCDGFRVAAVTHLGGSSAGEELSLSPPDTRGLPTAGGAWFPLNRGESRAVLFWTLGEGYDGPLTVIPAVVVQTDYLGAEPRVLLHDALHEPVRTRAGEKRRLERESSDEDKNTNE